MQDPSDKSSKAPRKARPLLRSAALAVIAAVGCDDDERGPQVIGNPKGSWYDASVAGQGGGGAGDSSVTSSNPKSSWYDSGLNEQDAGESDGGLEPENE